MRFRLDPQAFWALSLVEWRLLLSAFAGEAAPMGAGDLLSLVQLYPDETHAR